MSGVGLTAAAVTETPPPPVTTVETPQAETVTETPVVAAAETETPVTETPVVEEKPKQEPRGAVAELIERRTENRLLKERVEQYERDPVMQRLTPELRAAIADGRVSVQPPRTDVDQERDRLTQVAEEVGLLTAEGKPDLDAARRVDKLIRGTAAAVMAPVQEKVHAFEKRTLAQQADHHMGEIWADAKTRGISDEALAIARQEFEAVMAQPNAEQMLSQRAIAETIFDRAMGRALREGKLTGSKPAKAASTTPAIVTESGGRRGPSAAAIQLTPSQLAVYANAGLDPTKTPSATRTFKADKSGGVEIG